MIKLLVISDGHATCDFEDSEGLFDGCHILLNGLCGLELQGVELIRCLPDVADTQVDRLLQAELSVK